MTPIVNYASLLRAIGQALEVLQIESFDMELEGNDEKGKGYRVLGILY